MFVFSDSERLKSVIDDLRADIMREFREVKRRMADVSNVLNEVADGLRGPLATSITDLINENRTLREQNASLTNEDVAESSAAANVKTAFDEVAAKFTPVEEVPDVPELPVEDGTGTGEVVEGGGTADTEQPAPDVNPNGNEVATDENGNPV